MYKFDENYLTSQLRLLSHKQKIAFALLISERLYPNYIIFSKHHSWGKPEILRKSLDLAWSMLEGFEVLDRVDELILNIDKITPDTVDFDKYVSQALDASCAASNLMELLKIDSVEKDIIAASFAINTINQYIEVDDVFAISKDKMQFINDPEMHKKLIDKQLNLIFSHPLMQKELQRQHKDIELLKDIDFSDSSAVKDLKRRYRNQKVSNIGLG